MNHVGRFIDARRLAYLNGAAVARNGVADFDTLIDAVRGAYLAHADGDVVMPKSEYLRYPGRPGYDRIIPLLGHLGGAVGVSGLKQICSSTDNGGRGFPRASGLIILNEPASNRPFAVLEGASISAARTAAVTGLALRQLAGAARRRVAIVGCGQLGQTHLQMLAGCYGRQRFDYRLYDHAAPVLAQAAQCANRLGLDFACADSARDAIAEADIVITATTAEQPYIGHAWLKPDALYCAVSLMDAHLDLFQNAALIVVDDLNQCLHEGRPLQTLAQRGLLPRERIVELGQHLKRPAPLPERGTVVFNPMGTVITDLAVAMAVFERALANADYQALEM